MMRILAAGALILLLWWVVARHRRQRLSVREAFIRGYAFPKGLYERLGERYPHLSAAERAQVGHGLKQFFLAYARTGKFVSMPSQSADALWHEFILYTRAYEVFCRQAFGRFMHHTPAVALEKRRQGNGGLHRIWHETCRQEGIQPSRPARLPLLFALDGMLQIPGGFFYHPDCKGLIQADASAATVYCAGDFGGSSSCGGDGGSDTDGDGDGGSDSGGDSGCSGGCGGD
ncbi:glycine-rich domain-containing protein [Noviherbaspirillum galbum]|uniref:Uncharacterized protein n=1 Tax=Noviherbaspirillum galbum TaxID=2709383 RepID=A0A6B3SFY9_9BURK|nr:hypothetical protein [Noviherbaspirillum galbum]NEX59751.1 hypothetical protein [Noviherbaspirillum galbum]